MDKYRIVKKSYRNDEDATIYETFHIEYLGTNIFGTPKWKPVRMLACGWGDVYYTDVAFSKPEDALKYVNNLCKPVPSDEVVPMFAFKFNENTKNKA